MNPSLFREDVVHIHSFLPSGLVLFYKMMGVSFSGSETEEKANPIDLSWPHKTLALGLVS